MRRQKSPLLSLRSFIHTSFPWEIIWLIVYRVGFVQFIKNLMNKLFPSCVNRGERFFREESDISSAGAE